MAMTVDPVDIELDRRLLERFGIVPNPQDHEAQKQAQELVYRGGGLGDRARREWDILAEASGAWVRDAGGDLVQNPGIHSLERVRQEPDPGLVDWVLAQCGDTFLGYARSTPDLEERRQYLEKTLAPAWAEAQAAHWAEYAAG